MFVVTKDGKKLPVDDSSIDYENYYVPFAQNVGLYTDDTRLDKVWILELNHVDWECKVNSNREFELDYVKDIRYDHKPTDEEILHAMSANGLTVRDIAIVREGYELNFGEGCK